MQPEDTSVPQLSTVDAVFQTGAVLELSEGIS